MTPRPDTPPVTVELSPDAAALLAGLVALEVYSEDVHAPSETWQELRDKFPRSLLDAAVADPARGITLAE